MAIGGGWSLGLREGMKVVRCYEEALYGARVAPVSVGMAPFDGRFQVQACVLLHDVLHMARASNLRLH